MLFLNTFLNFFYTINYPEFEKDLAQMELKYLFKKDIREKQFFSSFYIPTSRSAFLKECLQVMYTGNTVDELLEQIKDNNIAYEAFKVRYIKHEKDTLSHEERLLAIKAIGFTIEGEADIHKPQITLGVTNIDNQWLFGIYEKNNLDWQAHEQKPRSYSNALGVRTARSLVNIAASIQENCRIIDPCCGVGTVVIEGLALGLNIVGYEINPLIGNNAKRNLEFFGYKDVITIASMHDIKEVFDVAIVDMPYGLFSRTTLEAQRDIIRTTRRIARKALFVTLENMNEHIVSAGFTIIDQSQVCKGKFKRYIVLAQ
ncbi:MAG: SAM-dependent methyltransferase [Clostridiales bacterium]|nr:SAM-dependent methyltransferase [Clostridiales bacterium]